MTKLPSLHSRRKRAHFRAWHRGMKEMDMILGGYAESHVSSMDDDELTEFEALMENLDRDLFKWFTGEAAVPNAVDGSLFRKICAHHAIQLP